MLDWTARIPSFRARGPGWGEDWPSPAPAQPDIITGPMPPDPWERRGRSALVTAVPPLRVRDPDEPRPSHPWYPPVRVSLACSPVGGARPTPAPSTRYVVRHADGLECVDRGRRVAPAPVLG